MPDVMGSTKNETQTLFCLEILQLSLGYMKMVFFCYSVKGDKDCKLGTIWD